MRAAFITAHGGNEVVSLGKRPHPARRQGEVLVRIKAATVNRVDIYMRDSGAGISHALPQILGVDGAGIVEEVEGGDPALRPGQHVVLHPAIACGRCEFCRRGDQTLCKAVSYIGENRDGTFAEYISVPAMNVFPKPENLNFAEAASLGVTYLTAWRMVFSKAQVKPWESVLIFGIGGGVSLAALQLVKMIGATAIVTSRDPDKIARAKQMGADEGIDSSRDDFVNNVLEVTNGRGVDVVIENIGEDVWRNALRSLVRGGRIVTCGSTSGDHPSADLRRLFARQIQVFGSTLGSFGEFHDLLRSVSLGAVKPFIGSNFKLGEVHSALELMQSGKQYGKIVMEID